MQLFRANVCFEVCACAFASVVKDGREVVKV